VTLDLPTYLTLQHHGPLTATQLANKLNKPTPSITRVLTRLHKHGYVTHTIHDNPLRDAPGPTPRLWRCTEEPQCT
jgi:DNA-binding MarR family transcriptional regulator